MIYTHAAIRAFNHSLFNVGQSVRLEKKKEYFFHRRQSDVYRKTYFLKIF